MSNPAAVPRSVTSGHAAPPLGTLHDLGGRRLMLHRSGTGGPTVVFLPGAGMVGLDLLNVHDLAARHTTSVVYDRGGTGWSDAIQLPRSAGEVVAELRELLGAAELPAPYLLVGHSLGGGYARHYAQRFPREVAALLLMDPAHEDLSAHMPRQVQEAASQMKDHPMPDLPAEVINAFRLLFEQKFAAWPAPVRDALIAYHTGQWRIGVHEASNADDVVYPELRGAGPMPDVPLIVLTTMGIDEHHTMGMSVEVQREVNEGKRTVNIALARSVPGAEHRELLDATHTWVHIDRPDAVLHAITDLMDRVTR